MKIGIFDSGLGGLLIAKSIIQELPRYDYVYLGDTKRVPYGGRSEEAVTEFTLEAVKYLIEVQNCGLVVVACNTASAEALRTIQQGYLAKKYPDRRVLGVLIPAAEQVRMAGIQSVGVLATVSTVRSEAFVREIHKVSPRSIVHQQPAPLLVPLIENNGLMWVEPILKSYLEPLMEKGVEGIVLGCTHYILLKDMIRGLVHNRAVISQDEIIPGLLADYLLRHFELEAHLTQYSTRKYCVTDSIENAGFQDLLTVDERENIVIVTV